MPLVEITGIVMSSDSLNPVSYCNIGIKNSHRGTASDYTGFFSIVTKRTDTLVFSAIGYDRSEFVLPPDFDAMRYSVIQLMTADTVNLPETIVYPWPKPHEFRSDFLKLDIPDDDIARAKKNLSQEQLRMRAYVMTGDAGENQVWAQQQRTRAYWTYKQPPHNNLINPLAWAEFIRAWKRGDFKKKKNRR